jgi:hypothetical protein
LWIGWEHSFEKFKMSFTFGAKKSMSEVENAPIPTPSTPTPPAKAPKIRPELMISIISLVVSMTALFTNLFQTRLQREQQQTSVWPYIECNYTISDKGFIYTVANKGVGPAIITKETYKYKGKEYTKMSDFIRETMQDTALTWYISGTMPVNGRVLSPQEVINSYNISKIELAVKAINLTADLESVIEYKSIYGKRFLSRNNKVEEVE